MAKDDIKTSRSPDPIVDIDKGRVTIGRENLHAALPPHASYEGGHRFDPLAEWSPEEEKAVVRKTDLRLLTWLCVMVRDLPRWVASIGMEATLT
ncbi:hypothetical protein IMZ48_20880 [Candidatus Bathyarchaeota archaeon]|nr:hypothetical protein [Candidatus Bathyarchaeota archaeon]